MTKKEMIAHANKWREKRAIWIQPSNDIIDKVAGFGSSVYMTTNGFQCHHVANGSYAECKTIMQGFVAAGWKKVTKGTWYNR